ncbi:MAG: hypothetical protein JST17_05055 [Bacteroidetes bacterium]|nr:hypothetical protein [Bacteroidota bacterium]MBS1932043.1 hypothetical protein [Bacteroidota bacterium]
MKTAKYFAIALLTLSSILLSYCTPNQTLVSSTDEMLTRSNWGVDYFYDTQDMTSEYGGYRILFSSTGAAAAQIQHETITGTWNISYDVNSNEFLSINFNTSNPNISKFNQQWKLTGKTTTTLQFEEAAHTGIASLLRIKKQ